MENVVADLNDRRTFIGGSDAPVIMGISPYKSSIELWLEKTGQAEAPDISEVERVRFGVILEDVVAKEFGTRTGMKVRRVRQRVVSKKYPWMVAQIDRRIIGGGILECKTTDSRNYDQWEYGIPDHIQVQVQHQMMVTGESHAYVAVLIGGNRLKIFSLERDERLIADLEYIENDFWECVQSKKPPTPRTTEDAKALWRNPQEQVVIGGDEELSIIKELVEVEEALDSYKKKKDELQLALQKRLENIGDILAINGTPMISWKMRSKTTIDTEALKEAYPDIANQFKKTSESRYFLILKAAKTLANAK